MNDSVLTPMQNDNILIYNGNDLPIEIRDNVTKSIENLFNSCKCLYDARIQKGPHSVWYILNKNVIIDFTIACLAFIKKLDNEICMIVTDKNFRKKEYAINMLTFLNEEYPKTSLWVRTTNLNAINLYKNKMGYKIIELKKDFYEYTGINCDGINMEKINRF